MGGNVGFGRLCNLIIIATGPWASNRESNRKLEWGNESQVQYYDIISK